MVALGWRIRSSERDSSSLSSCKGPWTSISSWSRRGSTSLHPLVLPNHILDKWLLITLSYLHNIPTYITSLNYLKYVHSTVINGLCSLGDAAAGTNWGSHGIIEPENHLDWKRPLRSPSSIHPSSIGCPDPPCRVGTHGNMQVMVLH